MINGMVVLVGQARLVVADVVSLIEDDLLIILAGSPTEAAKSLLAFGEVPRDQGRKDSSDRNGLVIDVEDHRVYFSGQELSLTPQEFRLLEYLTRERRVCSFRDLAQHACGGPYLGDPSALHAAIKRMRRKLAEAEAGLDIESVRGIGFRIIGHSGGLS